MSRKLLAVLALGLLAVTPAVASAQLSTSFSLSGGLAMPKGEGSDQIDNGYNAAVGLNLGAPLLPVGIRLEGAYNNFNAKGSTTNNSANATIASGTVNATVGLGMPYLIGGVGYYTSGGSQTVSNVKTTFDRVNAMGINGGVGIKLPFPMLSPFAEIRYHKVYGDIDASYIPVTVGITF